MTKKYRIPRKLKKKIRLTKKSIQSIINECYIKNDYSKVNTKLEILIKLEKKVNLKLLKWVNLNYNK